MALQPDDLLGDAALQAAVAALAERNHHHLADMSDEERADAVAHWRELAMTVLVAARTAATSSAPAADDGGGRAAIELEDLGGGEVAATPAQATALELLEQLAGDDGHDGHDEHDHEH